MKSSDKDPHKIRLQVALSRSGICSRREALDVVKSGRVKVAGKVVKEPSTPVSLNQKDIEVDGKRLGELKYSYILFNKPGGYVTTRHDRFAKKTIYDLLPKDFKKLVPVGRLDRDTEGLLILTNDGDLCFKLTHPKFHLNKVYDVRVFGQLDRTKIKKLESGINIEKKKTAPAKIEKVSISKGQTQFQITIHEGRKRQIRLMLKAVEHKVVYLRRIAQGPIELGRLKIGKFRELNEEEVATLKKL